MAGLAATSAPLAVGTAGAAGTAMAIWTEVSVKDGAMVGQGTMAAALLSGTDVVMTAISVASWTDTVTETAAVLS